MKVSAKQLIDMADVDGHIIVSDTYSSLIEQLAYDLYTRTCIVTINNTDYPYFNVPFHKFYRFVNSESVGSFFNLYVRGRW